MTNVLADTPKRTLFICFGVAMAIAATYWFCLRFLFPGYFAPLSAFHVDFYEYASLRDKSLEQILKYPRPAAYYAMKVLGFAGLYSAMAGGIAVALAGIGMTVVLARRMVCKPLAALPVAALLYCLLLFAHPDFYFEHRHDLPAEVSYLFAIGSLLCWIEFLKWRRRTASLFLLLGALLLAVLFVFAKETYFASALCLVGGMLLLDRENRRWHAGFLILLVALEIGSFIWTAHLNGPFVNTHADANGTYKIVLTPLSIARTYWYYLSHLFNPFLAIALAYTFYLIKDKGQALITGVVFFLAGLAAFGPHALLPNHMFEEYTWAAAPLVLAPVLLLGEYLWPMGKRTAIFLSLIALTLFGPWSYRPAYQGLELTYNVTQDKIGRNMARSIRKLHAIQPGSRVLVAGLDATYIPFRSESFMLVEFGEHITWTLLTGPGIPERQPNRVTTTGAIQQITLTSYDQLVSYDSDGSLRSIRALAGIPAPEKVQPDFLAPEVRSFAALVEKYPREGYRKFLAANACLDWGLWNEAQKYLAGAAANGSASDPTYRQLMDRLDKGLREQAAAATEIHSTTLTARPARIVDRDGSGLGETELVWTIAPPRPCEIHVGAPDGKLFSVASTSGSAKTDKWVRDGMKFFLQDVSGGKSLSPENTLATVTVEVAKN